MPPFETVSQYFDLITDNIANQGYVIVPGFLPDDFIHALRDEALALHEAGRLKRATVGKAENNQLDNKVRGDLIHWLEHTQASPVQREFSAIMETLRESLNRHLFLGLFELENHFAIYPPGAIYNKHLDQFRGNEERQVTCILYLNEDWKAEYGGQLRLYLDGKEPEPYIDTVPLGGTLVAFLSGRFWHEVLPASQPRISLTGWFRKRGPSLP
ncbi:2OG-Fe(II) oxygenase [Methylobacillus flagellatus]|uniref:2OG-Fe(II) oxygenase n=1 Tax=Methylobacillus flagellatus (strain ATCC 51484 / DSM 6875 / VKM B-1610 / KT) TaxID=265072 RepID=Q1GZN8_METFK|nr:2OG-Fe(II) oxygenase [Methylobacillus flagellatus]ABE50299.1 2OG-Fe(II) oxygenase [Methylobacillus flagellatus KT]